MDKQDVRIISDDCKFKLRVAGFFIVDNKILADKYGSDSYILPGGFVSINESSDKAILRELKEEINLDFEIIKFAGLIENFFTNIKQEKTHAIDLFYKVKLLNENDLEKINYTYEELDNGKLIKHDYHWININELMNVNLLPSCINKDILLNDSIFHIVKVDDLKSNKLITKTESINNPEIK